MSFGFALGIFAIFSLIRYRTAPISPREMTYIFLSTGIAAKNLLAPTEIEFYKLLLTDGFIVIIAGFSEFFLFRIQPKTKLIIYDNLDLIQQDKREILKNELAERFGISQIKTMEIGKIDAVKNLVRIKVTFVDNEKKHFEDF